MTRCRDMAVRNFPQNVVRGITNPATVLPRSQRPKTAISLHSQSLGGSTGLPDDHNQTKYLWPVITNNLTFDPVTRLPELTQNWIRSSHGHYTPSLKIACKSVQPFSRNHADKQTNKQRKKERNHPKTIPRPPIGGGVKMRGRSVGGSVGPQYYIVLIHSSSLR